MCHLQAEAELGCGSCSAQQKEQGARSFKRMHTYLHWPTAAVACCCSYRGIHFWHSMGLQAEVGHGHGVKACSPGLLQVFHSLCLPTPNVIAIPGVCRCCCSHTHTCCLQLLWILAFNCPPGSRSIISVRYYGGKAFST